MKYSTPDARYKTRSNPRRVPADITFLHIPLLYPCLNSSRSSFHVLTSILGLRRNDFKREQVCSKLLLTLQVVHRPASYLTEVPDSGVGGPCSFWHAHHGHQQVRHRQVDQEVVGHTETKSLRVTIRWRISEGVYED